MSFAQKFGIKYYAYLVNCIAVIVVFETTRSMERALFCVTVVPILGRLLPPDDELNTPYGK